MDIEAAEREAFEKWWQSRGPGWHRPSRNGEPGYGHEYENPSAQMAWKGWVGHALSNGDQ